MQTFDSIADARNAIMDYRADHGSELKDYLTKRFRELSASPSPVDQIVGLAEMIWANREDMPKSSYELGAGLVAFATVNAWHGLQENNRGDAILANFRKLLGEVKSAPTPPDAAVGAKVESAPAPVPGAEVDGASE